ncbi:MAG: stage V sporulation protein AB, partial [Clostridium sp.]
VMNRRIHLSVGLQYLILSIAFGKMTGSLLYFMNGFGG